MTVYSLVKGGLQMVNIHVCSSQEWCFHIKKQNKTEVLAIPFYGLKSMV